MKTPHKHADLIKAWADGAKIEFRWDCLDDWRIITSPLWDQDGDYRIKPEPKPDATYSLCLHLNKWGELDHIRLEEPNLKLTFDGETGKLKAAEVIA